MNQKGFANIVLIILVVILVGATGYFAFREPITEQIQTTDTASFPGNNTSPQPPLATSETANWKVYRNEKYRFEFTYPPTYTAKTENNSRNTIVFGSDQLTFGVFIPDESEGLGLNE